MTIRQINTLFREAEEKEFEDPKVRLVVFVAILGSLKNGETVTDEAIGKALIKFVELNGQITQTNVDAFVYPLLKSDVDIPDELITEVLSNGKG